MYIALNFFFDVDSGRVNFLRWKMNTIQITDVRRRDGYVNLPEATEETETKTADQTTQTEGGSGISSNSNSE